MKSALIVMALAGVAAAAPIKPPTGWTADPDAAVSLSQKLGALPHFGGLSSVVTTEAYRAPAGGSLFVTRVIANTSTNDNKVRDAAVAAELADLQAAAVRSGGKSDGAKISRIDEARLLVGEVIWQDDAVITYAGMIVAADAQHVTAVSGECVLAKDAAKDIVTACRGALASMDPEVPPATRVELSIVAPPVAATPTVKPPSMQPPAGSSSPGLIDADHRPGLPPMSIPQASKEADRRPIYVGLGLIVLAAIFWWNRKQREKLETDYEARTGGGKRDRDADDLHAAADEPDKVKAAADDEPRGEEVPRGDKGDTKEEKA